MLFRALTPLFPITVIMDFWLYIENGKFLDLTSNVILNQREIIFPTIYYMMYFGEIDFFAHQARWGVFVEGGGGGGGVIIWKCSRFQKWHSINFDSKGHNEHI